MDTPARNPFFRGFLKQTLAVVFFFLLIFLPAFILPASTQAQSNYPSSYASPNTNPDVPRNQHILVQSILLELLSAGICQLSGVDIITPSRTCLSVDPRTEKLGYAPENTTRQPGGLLGFAVNGISILYDTPIHTRDYVQYMAGNFGLAQPAYANGNDGFTQLTPLLAFWKVFRDIAFLGFVLAFVVIGLAVMLRVKIDPRTVMSIQNQLPKIVVTMILITFSYAIVGFLADLMWATTYVGINLAETANKQVSEGEVPRLETNEINKHLIASPFSFLNAVTQNLNKENGDGGTVFLSRKVAETFGDISIAFSPFKDPGPCDPKISLGPLTLGDGPGNLANCAGHLANGVFQWIATVLGFFIVLVALLIVLAKIWWMLLKSFAYIIVYTAIAPVYIMAGIFPGSTLGIGPWIRGLVANMAIFPITVMMFLVARVFMNSFSTSLTFAPPLIGTPQQGVNGMGYIIGIAIIFIIPEMLIMVREALKTPPNKYVAPAILGGFQKGASVASAIPSKTWGKFTEKDQSGKAKGQGAQFLAYGAGDQANRLARGLRSVFRFATGTSAQERSEANPRGASDSHTRNHPIRPTPNPPTTA